MRNYKYQILFFIFLVFLLQPLKLGFEQGHHGWVSSHVLAQIRNASPENYFLGFARNAGSWYFDRYPVVFSGLSHLLLSPFWESFETYIYMARQWMNIIYIITSFLIFRICLQFVHKPKALAITFFTISATFFIKYKDMVHFDQPAVLGCLMVLNGIIDFEKYRKKRMLLISSLVGPILGRGYAVIFFLASWVIVKGIYELLFLKKKTITRLKIPILITLVSVPLPATMLSLNIWGEAKIRNLDWDQTSIVVSARKRLGIDSYTEVGKEKKKVKTVSFVLNQIYRAFDMVTPYAISGLHFKGYTNKLRHYLTVIPKVIFQIWILFFLFKILPHFWKLTTSFEKYLFNILIWGGILWLVVMKNLSHYHEYVSLYLVGLSLVFFYYLVNWIESKGKNPLKIAAAIFCISLLINCLREIPVSKSVAWQIPEFEKLRTEISTKNAAKVYFETEGRTNFLHGVPYLESFFLSGRDNLTYIRDEANFLVKLRDNKLIIQEQIK